MAARGSGSDATTAKRNRENPIKPGDVLDSLGRKRKVVMETMTWHELVDDPTRPGRKIATGVTEEREVPVPPEDFRCRARSINPDNPYQGQRCRHYRIRGGVVCLKHGGNLPNVKKAAQTRLLMAANPAIERLIHIATTKNNVKDTDRIRAICEILDRAGIVGKSEVTVEIKPWQDMLRRIAGSVEPGSEGSAPVELIEGQDFWVDYDGNAEDQEDGQEDDTEAVRPTRRPPTKGRAASRR